jgi:DNA-binding transcriptional regulator LsrR (DeoR family)
MPVKTGPGNLPNLHAEIAEMYFHEGITQAQIADKVGINRSMVSRILAEARRKGIVEVKVHRPVMFDRELQERLVSRFRLHSAYVFEFHGEDAVLLKAELAEAGAYVLKKFLIPGSVLGLAWGSTVHETVKAFRSDQSLRIKIVQLVGAIGARNTHFDGHWLVQSLSEKVNGEGYYLNAPFMVGSPEVARALVNDPSISEVIRLWKQIEIGLFGIGTVDPRYSSFYNAGFVDLDELEKLSGEGAVGDVCGLHFNVRGQVSGSDFESHLIVIPRGELLQIPIRLGVAGGRGKTSAILGALRGSYINVLVTDSQTATELLQFEDVRT